MTIKIPKTWRGIDGKEAYERIVNAKEPEQSPIIKTNVKDLDDFIYVPSINLYIAKQRTLQGKNWFECHEKLGKQGYRMLIIPEFIEFLKYARDNFPDIYNDITEVRTPWRAEWIDAYFEKRKDGLYILTGNKTKAEKLEDCLMKDKTPGIYLDDWLEGKNTNSQGFPKSKMEKGELCYWYPRDGQVARFIAYSGGAVLSCDRDPSDRDSDLGVFGVMEVSKVLLA